MKINTFESLADLQATLALSGFVADLGETSYNRFITTSVYINSDCGMHSVQIANQDESGSITSIDLGFILPKVAQFFDGDIINQFDSVVITWLENGSFNVCCAVLTEGDDVETYIENVVEFDLSKIDTILINILSNI